MVDAPSFTQPHLCLQALLQFPPKIRSTSVTFQIPFPPLLVQKIIFTISTNTPFLYTSAIFHLPKLLRPIYPKNIFPTSAI